MYRPGKCDRLADQARQSRGGIGRTHPYLRWTDLRPLPARYVGGCLHGPPIPRAGLALVANPAARTPDLGTLGTDATDPYGSAA